MPPSRSLSNVSAGNSTFSLSFDPYLFLSPSPREVVISQTSPDVPPILGSGVLTVDTFIRFERAARRYFSVENIAVDCQVEKIISHLDHEAVLQWAEANRVTLESGPFSVFMKDLRSRFLSAYWDDDLAFELRTPQGHLSFREWEMRVRTCNYRLAGSPRQKDNTFIREHLRDTMEKSLKRRYREVCFTKDLELILDLDKWVKEVSILACMHEEQVLRDFEFVRDLMIQGSGGPQLAANHSSFSSRPPHLLPSYIPAPTLSSPAPGHPSLLGCIGPRVGAGSRDSGPSSDSGPGSGASGRFSLMDLYNQLPKNVPRPPSLTQSILKFLKVHKGCFRCRDIYVDHIGKDCDLEKNLKARCWEQHYSDGELSERRRLFLARRNNASVSVMDVHPVEEAVDDYVNLEDVTFC